MLPADLTMAGLLGLTGLVYLLKPRSEIDRAQADHAAKLAARHARGYDAYHEELRSLEAYRPTARPVIKRRIGVVLLALSIALTSLHFVKD